MSKETDARREKAKLELAKISAAHTELQSILDECSSDFQQSCDDDMDKLEQAHSDLDDYFADAVEEDLRDDGDE